MRKQRWSRLEYFRSAFPEKRGIDPLARWRRVAAVSLGIPSAKERENKIRRRRELLVGKRRTKEKRIRKGTESVVDGDVDVVVVVDVDAVVVVVFVVDGTLEEEVEKMEEERAKMTRKNDNDDDHFLVVPWKKKKKKKEGGDLVDFEEPLDDRRRRRRRAP
jgi:hypothetical protein